jgi:phosphatidate cytidylyltransferase
MAGDRDGGTGAAPEPARRAGWRGGLAGLGQRAATAFILMPVVIAIAWFGGWVAFAGLLVVAALGLWELRAMLARRSWHPTIALSGALCLDFLLAAMLPHARAALLALGISALVVGSFAWQILSRRRTVEGALADWAATMALPFYLGWPLALILLLRGGTPGYHSPGFWWTLTALFTVWAFDTFAFFAGKLFGRTHLAELVSPKKTWEGLAGGVLFALLAAWLFTRPIGVPWYHALAVGVLVSVAATVGDLAESLLKRDLGVKDSGTLVAGHGGVLDRVDSLLFGGMVVFFYAAFLGSIGV